MRFGEFCSRLFDEKYGGEIIAEPYYEPPALGGGAEQN